MAEPNYKMLAEVLSSMTDEQSERVRRITSGEAENDLIRRGDVQDEIRALRMEHPASMADPASVAYQKALTDVSRALVKVAAKREGKRKGCYGATHD